MRRKACKNILVSACLVGLASRYDGTSKANDCVLEFVTSGDWTAIPVCPEQLGGSPTPRAAAQFSSGDGDRVLAGDGQLINSRRENVNRFFINGAQQALAVAELNGSTLAIMKERSPSCGVNRIYRNNSLVRGSGVTTALLSSYGIDVFSEGELSDLVERFATGEALENESNQK